MEDPQAEEQPGPPEEEGEEEEQYLCNLFGDEVIFWLENTSQLHLALPSYIPYDQ